MKGRRCPVCKQIDCTTVHYQDYDEPIRGSVRPGESATETRRIGEREESQ